MASPTLESRVEPHKKAHFNLQIGDQLAHGDASPSAYSSFKYNHKPTQGSGTRTTTLTSSSSNAYKLTLRDTDTSGGKDVFTFSGQKTAPKKSYVVIFDPSTQQATLEPLTSSFTMNLSTKNNKDISSENPRIYVRRSKEESQHKDEDMDLFGEAAGDDEAVDPDPENPYDFRHFLSKEKEKRGDESEYQFASSPDYRTGTGSASNTPQFGARKPPVAVPSKVVHAEAAPKKRKPAAAANPMVSKPKKAQPTPSVRLQRTATDTNSKPKGRVAGPPASKIKSVEIIHSSDESDIDAEGEAASSPPTRLIRSPSPAQQQSQIEDEDAEGESDDGDGDLEIEVPDARPVRRGNGALASLGLGPNLTRGFLKSPSNGPISLASATNSVEGSPNPHSLASRHNRHTQDEIDFGDMGGEDAEGEDDDDEDYNNRDIEPMDIGPPARQSTGGPDRKASVATGTVAADEDEDDLDAMIMEGLAGGDSSEESEEE